LLYFGYVLAGIAARILPLGLCYWIAERVADLWYALGASSRQALIYNLSVGPDVSKGEREMARLSRRIMRNFACMVAEFLYLPRLAPDHLDRLVDVETFGLLKDMVGDRKVILVTGHLGSWELGAAIGAHLGMDLHVVVYDHPDRRIARLFRERREAMGLKVMSVREAARLMRSVIKHSSIGVVGDRDFTGKGITSRFFDMPATMPSAYAGLAVSGGIPVVAGFCVKGPNGRYRLASCELVYSPDKTPKLPNEIVADFTAILEKCIETYPDQWYFFQKVGERAKPYA
jgi:KDO2-lipid IV(A) lauroyltransferase